MESTTDLLTNSHKVKKLVIDSSALIQNLPIETLGQEIFSIPEIINEIKDKTTRNKLNILPYKINYKDPSEKALEKAVNASKKIGDYHNLSIVDLKLIALAVQLAEEEGQEVPLFEVSNSSGAQTEEDIEVRKGPKKSKKKKDKKLLGWGSFDDDFMGTVVDLEESPKDELQVVEEENLESESNLQTTEPQTIIEEMTEMIQINQEDQEDSGRQTDENDGFTEVKPAKKKTNNDGWITLENIDTKDYSNQELENINVACATCDFSMQNTLIKLDVKMIGKEGRLIDQVRSWALRCASCGEITHDMSKIFCPKCGHRHTLKRVPYTVDKNGKKTYFLSKSKQPKCLNQRGLRYSIPHLKGGKHNNDPLLCETQRLTYDQQSKKAIRKQNQLIGDDFDDFENPFKMVDVSSRAVHKGNHSQRKKYAGGDNDVTAQQLRTGFGVGNNKKKYQKKRGKR